MFSPKARRSAIFPNPNFSQEKTTIRCNSDNIKSVILKDILGKEIKIISNLNSTEYNLDLSSLNNGVYFISIVLDGKTVNRQLIKN